jgi:hypothetical protein
LRRNPDRFSSAFTFVGAWRPAARYPGRPDRVSNRLFVAQNSEIAASGLLAFSKTARRRWALVLRPEHHLVWEAISRDTPSSQHAGHAARRNTARGIAAAPGTFTAVTSSAVGASEHLKPEVWSLWSADSLGRRKSKHTLYSKQSSNDTRFVCTRDLAET